MYTLGTTPVTICKLEESYSLNIGVISTPIVQRGQMVKLVPADGTVVAVAAVTDKPFGMVVAGNTEANSLITVQTEFNAVVRCAADGAIAIGDQVSCSGVQTTGEKLSKFKKSVATNVVSGIALSAGADTESVMIGILRTSSIL